MLPRTISHTTPYGIVAVCHAASLIGLWALKMQVGRCCGFQPLTFLLCASTNIGTENVLSQLVNELMNKCPPPLFSVADLKAGVFILPSPSSAIVPHLAFSSFCFFFLVSAIPLSLAPSRPPCVHMWITIVYRRGGCGRSEDRSRVHVHEILKSQKNN